MSRHPALIVAAWEFRRYFKWKDQLIGLVSFLVIGLIWYGASRLAQARGRTMTVALVELQLVAPPSGRVRFVPAAEDSLARAEALRRGDVHGILRRAADGTFHLLVEKDPRYRNELAAILADTVRRERLAASGIGPADLAQVLTPPALEVTFSDPGRARRGRGEMIVAGALIAVMLVAVFTSMAYLLAGITGEKQLRVTESVVSAISPQAWIDGKVLGLSGYALTGVANMAIGGAVIGIAATLATDFSLPAAAVRPGVLLVLLLYSVLGLLLWNSFFAAVASTIDDPNTSSRTSLMMLPALPQLVALAVFRDPDSIVSRGLALFPLTSVPALPVRLVLSDPHPLEIAGSVALLAGAIWLTRRLAGRIFEVGMLLYGKEPTWREISRWARRGGAVG
jgi:ABC-2 type transport system permease protein